jgi:hypothetical protein
VAAHLLVSVEVLLDGRFIQMNRLSSGWLDYLDEEDLAFIKRLVMASGSLKEVAAGYGISYPTVRLRLDRLIAKITITDSQAIQSEFERLPRTQHAEGKIDADTLKTLPGAYRLETEDKKKDRASRSA